MNETEIESLRLPQHQNAQAVNVVRSRLVRELPFLHFYLLPELASFQDDLAWMSKQTGFELLECKERRDDLLNTGFWIQDATRRIRVGARQLNLADEHDPQSALTSFVLMATQINLAVQEDDRRSVFSSRIQSTNKELYTKFKQDFKALEREFIRASEQSKADMIISYAASFFRFGADPERSTIERGENI
jgi:hypothetical protein